MQPAIQRPDLHRREAWLHGVAAGPLAAGPPAPPPPPTPSAPAGPGGAERWAARGEAHFRALGAQPVAVVALDRQGCHAPEYVEAVRRADLVYFSGGKPGYLLHTLR